jgi:hypothetical protein
VVDPTVMVKISQNTETLTIRFMFFTAGMSGSEAVIV